MRVRLLLFPALLLAASPARGDESATTVAPAPSPPPPSPPRVPNGPRYGVGLRVRGIFLPDFMLSPFLAAGGGSRSVAVGAEFLRRRPSYDIVLSIDASFYPLPDGNYLSAGKSAALDTHYTRFRDLTFVSTDIAFVYHRAVAPWLELMVGGGIGIGMIFGDVYVVNNSRTVCTSANAGDASSCYPVVDPTRYDGPAPTYLDRTGKVQPIVGPLLPSDPDFQRKLDGLSRAQAACRQADTAGKLDCRDTADHPYYRRSDVPPVMVVVNVVVGAKFRLHRGLHFNVSGGFRNGFFFGGGPEYVF